MALTENLGLKGEKSKIVSTLLLSGVLLSIIYLIPLLIGFGKGGFSEEAILKQFQIYNPLGTAMLVGVLIFYLIEHFVMKGDEKYGSTIYFNSQGEGASLPFFKRFSNFKLFFFFSIIFGILGLLNTAFTKQTFIGVAVLQQQFTKLDSLLFSSSLVPASENLISAFVLALSITILLLIARSKDMSSMNFKILTYFLIPLIVGLFGLFLHFLRYSGTDINLFFVFMFWFMGGLLTVLVGSFIPFWVMHISNNLFFDLGRQFSSDRILILTIIVLVLMVISYLLIYVRKK